MSSSTILPRPRTSLTNVVVGGLALILVFKAVSELRHWSGTMVVAQTGVLSTASFPLKLLPSTRLVSKTPFVSLHSAPSASYSLYIPPQHYNPDPTGSGPYKPADPQPGSPYTKPRLPLVVTVHGTTRDAAAARDELVALANTSRAAILAPLFPAGISSANDFDSYKTLRPASGAPPSVHFDQILRDILQDVDGRWPGIDTSRIVLVGFSGGGSFALRFALAWPHLLSAVSIGAPTGSSVLGADKTRNWPTGLADVRSIFGSGSFDLSVLDNLTWQLVIGSLDDALEGSLETIGEVVANETRDAHEKNRDEDWDAVIDRLRPDRESTLRQLAQGLREHGVQAEVQVVPGAHHSRVEVHSVVEQFLSTAIERYWMGH